MLFLFLKEIIMRIRVILSLIFGILWSCTSKVEPITTTITENNADALERPYVILISLDGFRWDYVEKFNPPNLSKFVESGVKAESLIPSYPTKTFPNHYTIATGMYPDSHGLVGNTHYSVKNKSVYSIGQRKKVQDGNYYGGTPIWVQANANRIVSASFFFVGSEADIKGIHPTYYYDYDGKITNDKRINQTLQWLEMPEKQRPHLITLYFSDMDDAGHRYGPNNEVEINKALQKVDSDLGVLFDAVDASELPIHIVIVSDHGMHEVKTQDLIAYDDIRNDELFIGMNNGSIINIHPKDPSKTDSIFNLLKSQENRFKVYKTENSPHFDYTPSHENWGPIQLVANDGLYFSSKNRIEGRIKYDRNITGEHGFPHQMKDMHGIFYAKGPKLKKGHTIPSFKNIHVYPLLCEILGIDPPKDIDGSIEPVKGALK